MIQTPFQTHTHTRWNRLRSHQLTDIKADSASMSVICRIQNNGKKKRELETRVEEKDLLYWNLWAHLNLIRFFFNKRNDRILKSWGCNKYHYTCDSYNIMFFLHFMHITYLSLVVSYYKIGFQYFYFNAIHDSHYSQLFSYNKKWMLVQVYLCWVYVNGKVYTCIECVLQLRIYPIIPCMTESANSLRGCQILGYCIEQYLAAVDVTVSC